MYRNLKYLLVCINLFFLLSNPILASIDTRLTFVGNNYNYPISGSGTLIINVEARSNDGSSHAIGGFQDAFKLSSTFMGQNPIASFSNQLFATPDYNFTYDLNDHSSSSSYGRVQYIASYNSGEFSEIGVDWITIITVSIEYTMISDTSSVKWFNGEPDYFVIDDSFINDITGSEENIPGILSDISLPVVLISFLADSGNKKVILSWETGSELNNKGFEIYRALNELGSYELIASFNNTPALQGAGNSSRSHSYNYVDKNLINGFTYWYKLVDVDYNGNRLYHGPISSTPTASSQNGSNGDGIPTSFVLYDNYPNPFNPNTLIQFDIPELQSGDTRVELTIFDVHGKKVRTLLQDILSAGSYILEWDGRNDQGNSTASGIYLYHLQTEYFSATRKMVLVK